MHTGYWDHGKTHNNMHPGYWDHAETRRNMHTAYWDHAKHVVICTPAIGIMQNTP